MIKQADPCQSKSSVVADVQYCDRYWECGPDNTKELYDCPNGLVWVGKNRGIADGCDYPWRNPSICANKDLASKLKPSDWKVLFSNSSNSKLCFSLRATRTKTKLKLTKQF